MVSIGKIYLFFAFLLAGTSVVTARILSDSLGVFTLTALSLGILLLCLLPFYLNRTIRTVRAFKKTDWILILLQATFGIFLFRVFLLLGLHFTSTGEAGIMTGASPALTSVLAFCFLKEPLLKKTGLGIGCTVAGIMLLQGAGDHLHVSLHHLGGNAWVLCAAASESIFNVVAKSQSTARHSSQEIHPMAQTLLVAAGAFLLSLLPALFEHPVTTIKAIGMEDWIALIWYGLVVTALSYACFFAGVKRTDAYTAAAFSGLMPVTAMLLSALLLGERTGFASWVGCAFVFLGMLQIYSTNPNQNALPNSTLEPEGRF
ncbi:DMT family transporter [Gorillibacterium massiliense]|uniref:DMT family transporter n=1 Tax=Gorillibacterium massiliense TaxID=1280390 RepID=UPI0004B891ED|nr:DMT family transporter [Gorillibacterium massiliense]